MIFLPSSSSELAINKIQDFIFFIKSLKDEQKYFISDRRCHAGGGTPQDPASCRRHESEHCAGTRRQRRSSRHQSDDERVDGVFGPGRGDGGDGRGQCGDVPVVEFARIRSPLGLPDFPLD